MTGTRNRHPIATVCYVLLDSLFLIGWHARGLRLRNSRVRNRVRYPADPILMLPGVYESPHFLDPLAAVLRRSGRPVYTVPELVRNRAPILDTARSVRTFLERADLTGVTIVAHSKGGLVGKQLMVWPETSHRVRSMIAIATPFAGSRYAKRAPTRVLRDFDPADRVLLELAANSDANARIVSVFGRFDPQIPDGSRLDGARNVISPVGGHFRLLARPGVHRLISSLIEDEVSDGRVGAKGLSGSR
jgi:pimeloyl-ACP methyl ester carboxylesterase